MKKGEKSLVTLTSVMFNFINLIQTQVRTSKNVLKIYHVGEMFVEMEIDAQNINDSETKFPFSEKQHGKSEQ